MGIIKDFIYPKLSVSMQNLAISAFGYYWKKRRFGGVFSESLVGFKQREKFNLKQWESYQLIELRKLLTQAYKNVPFYTQKFNQMGVTLNDLANFQLSDLNTLPFLEKSELRMFGKSSLLSTKLEKGGEFYSSSGSTGTPTQILVSNRMHQIWSAGFEARIRNWAGVSNSDERGMIGGRRILQEANSKPPYYRYNCAEKQTYFSAYHISKKTAENYLQGIIENNVKYMTGYALSNYSLARFLEEKGLKAPQLKAVITSSEKLTQEMRDTFQRVYGCKSYDGYSGVEACGHITECEHGSLHVSPDIGIIEIVKSDGSYALPGEEGEAVCTGFLNYDQPLIRYKIGDILKLSKNQNCACGREMTIIDEIIGRIEDVVIGIDGREMVRFHGIFIDIPSIIEGQIIQHTLQNFEIQLVLSKPLSEDDKSKMANRMISQLGNINLIFNTVDTIHRNQNGKIKAVISHVIR